MTEPLTHTPSSTSEVAKELGVSPSLVRTWISYMNWEVRRNAEGHRIFIQEDIEQLKQLKAWLDEGHSMKEYRREQQGEGEYDPRRELRAGYRRLRELHSQEEALVEKQREILDSFLRQRQVLQTQLEAMREGLDAPAPEKPPAPGPAAETDASAVVQGVLKQLLTALLEKQGKLQLVRRYDEDGRARMEYVAPTGKKQVVDDFCTRDEDRRLFETLLRVITHGG